MMPRISPRMLPLLVCFTLTLPVTAGPLAPDGLGAERETSPRMRLFEQRDDGQVWLRQEALAALRSAASAHAVIESVPVAPGRLVDLEVDRFHVTGPATQLVIGRPGAADAVLPFDADRVVLLRGQVVDHPSSHAYLALDETQVLGFVDLGPGAERYALRGEAPDRAAITFATGGAFAAPLARICGVKEPVGLGMPAGAPSGVSHPTQTRSVDLAVETDFEYYELFGDEEAATAYILALYGAITDIFLRDANARFNLSFIRIWDEPEELYDASDPLGPFRNHWNDNMGDVERDVAQLLTGRRNLPYGGVAWLSALCGTSGYSVAGYILGSFVDAEAPSSGNWDLVVAAHELGHNCGTLHTHSYGIDACASGDIQRGTIMSYCHTTTGGTANIDLRLHGGAVRDAIQSYLPTEDCVVIDCNGNGVADDLDIAQFGGSPDDNGNGIPDECEDCNDNGILDDAEIDAGLSPDVNGNLVPDGCEADCNGNGVPDSMDIELGTSEDLYGDGVPDECDEDCDGSGVSDYNEIQLDMSLDLDRNAVLDGCQDCDDDGTGDFEVLAGGLNLWVGSLAGTEVREFHASTGVPVNETGLTAGDHQDVVRGPDGAMYVSSGIASRIMRFDPVTGAALADFAGLVQGIEQPAGLAFRPNGNLLVANRATHSVLELTPEGAALGPFVAPGAGGLVEPFGLAFASGGNLLVTSADNRVLEYDGTTGSFVGVLVTAGSGGLSMPRGLLVLPSGNLLVASYGSNQVLEYDGGTGEFVGQFDRGGLPSGFWALQQPWGLRLSGQGDRVFVSSHQGNAAVHSYDVETGLFLRSFYVLEQNIAQATGFAVAAAGAQDCNMNLVPDPCDIAAGVSQDTDGDGVPDECGDRPAPCSADVDGNATVDVDDLVAVILAWGPCDGCDEDLNDDGAVDVDDLVEVILGWGPCE